MAPRLTLLPAVSVKLSPRGGTSLRAPPSRYTLTHHGHSPRPPTLPPGFLHRPSFSPGYSAAGFRSRLLLLPLAISTRSQPFWRVNRVRGIPRLRNVPVQSGKALRSFLDMGWQVSGRKKGTCGMCLILRTLQHFLELETAVQETTLNAKRGNRRPTSVVSALASAPQLRFCATLSVHRDFLKIPRRLRETERRRRTAPEKNAGERHQ